MSSTRTFFSKHVPLGLLMLATLLSLLLAACGSSSTATSSTTTKADVTAPTDLKSSGVLLIGSDTTYPPMEYIDTKANGPAGFDYDLAKAMADHMGLKLQFQTTSFVTIFDDLNNKRFDAVLSSVTINSDREKVDSFIPYFTAGESLLVAKGNPKHLTSVDQFCGMNLGVQTDTVELTDAQTASQKCVSSGKPKINLTSLASQTDVVQLLANGRVDATYQDSPVTDYYNKINPGQFEVGGSVVNSSPYGITIRKGDTSMFDALQKAFNAVKADGTYDKLFTKWDLSTQQKI